MLQSRGQGQISTEGLEKVQVEIGRKQRELRTVMAKITDLGQKLASNTLSPELLQAMDIAAKQINAEKLSIEAQIAALQSQEDLLAKQVKVRLSEKEVRKHLDRFDDLTRIEQRRFLESVLDRIVICRDNKLKLEFKLDGIPPELTPPKGKATQVEDTSSVSVLDGGR